jgi:transcriptional regulator with GAF, ATPase, and Fis domain
MQRLDGGRAADPQPGLVLLCAQDTACAPHVFRIREHEVVLGREPPSGGCAIHQTAVSRRHARLVHQGDGWQLEDLQSRNGTYVDGRRIGRTNLQDGAAIRVGDTLYKFVADDVEPYLPFLLTDDGSAFPGAPSNAVIELVGGMQMAAVADQITMAAQSDLAVLVLGETGTGKEVVSRAIHRLSGRAGPFVALNCAAIPMHLFESELFGFRKSAFTGATHDKPGILQAAAGGSVLLDEIGELPLEAQAKLLRVLESHEVTPLGSVRPERLDVRFVCATNRDLVALVDQGRFRPDLFARIGGYTISLPPLRKRKEDLYRLVLHFLRAGGRPDWRPSFAFMLAMCDYDWPQNVRECEGAVRRAIAVADEHVLQVRHLPAVMQARMETYGKRELDAAPRSEALGAGALSDENMLRALLVQHEGNVAAVARALGKDRAQVHRLIKRHMLVPGDFRPGRGD